jgi:hypothetical protein
MLKSGRARGAHVRRYEALAKQWRFCTRNRPEKRRETMQAGRTQGLICSLMGDRCWLSDATSSGRFQVIRGLPERQPSAADLHPINSVECKICFAAS